MEMAKCVTFLFIIKSIIRYFNYLFNTQSAVKLSKLRQGVFENKELMKGAAADSDQAAVDQGAEDGAEFYAFKMSQAEESK